MANRFAKYFDGGGEATNRFAKYFDTSEQTTSTPTNRFAKYFGKEEEEETTKRYSSQSSIDELKQLASEQGMKVKEDKPGLFRRGLDLISRPLYASAGAAKAVVKGENVLQEAWKGLSGQEKETYSDVLEEAGVENKWIKGGIGFALDVALDPLTYVGGSLMKGAAKGLGAAGKVGLAGGRKFNPQAVKALEATGTSLKDAFGYAFKHGYKTTTGLADTIAEHTNKLGMAKEGIVENVHKIFKTLPEKQHQQFAQTLLQHRKQLEPLTKKLGSRDLAKAQLNKMKPKFATSEQAAFFDKDYRPLMDNMADLADIPEKIRFDAYFPSMDVEKLAQKSGAGGLKVGKEGYNKLYRGVNQNELNKPIEALSRQTYNIVRDNTTRETLKESISAYGVTAKQWNKLDDVEKALYKPVYQKGFKPLSTYPVTTEAGKSVRALGKSKEPMGYLKADDFNHINSQMFPEMKAIDTLAKATGYDKFTNVFKAAVTAWFPAFHVRNYISGNIQNYSVLGAEAFRPRNIQNGLGIMRKTSSKLNFKNWQGTGAELNEILKKRFQGASRYKSDWAGMIDDLGDGTFKVKKNIQKLNPRQVGNFIEMNQKAVAVSGALNKGKTMKEALKLAEDAGFDYAKITPFEQKIMKRAIPFYCVPITHEILTKQGWKKHNDLKISELVLTSTIDGNLEWQPVEDIAIFDYAGILKKFERTGGKFLFTNDHRWLTETTKTKIKGKTYGGTRQIKRTYELNQSDIIPLTGKYINKKDFLSPRLIAILGWVVTDGYFRWRGNHCEMIIYQHPKKYLSEVEQLTGNKARKPHPESGVCAVPIKLEDMKKITQIFKNKKDLSNIVTKLSNKEIDSMYDAMMKAEGCCSKYTKNEYKITQYSFAQDSLINKDVSNAFQILLFLKGGNGNISQKAIYPKKSKYLRVKEGIKEEYYNGLIWCPKTKNGTWIMRNNGCMVITGNTFARKNAELQLKTGFKNPERILNQIKFTSNLSNVFGGKKPTEEDLKGLPPWALNGLGFKVEGNRYLTKFGLPLEEFVERIEKPFKTSLSSMNPIVKYPLESKMGFDFFRERKLTDIDKVAPVTGELIMNKAPDWLKEIMNVRKVETDYGTKYYGSSGALHKLRSIPTARLQATLERMFDKDLNKVDKWLAFLSGARIYDIDVEQQKYFTERDLRRDIEDDLMKKGVVGEFINRFEFKD